MRPKPGAEANQRLVGKRVRLTRCGDQYSPRKAGLEGTVMCIDTLGTIHVAWDDGSGLGLVPGEDQWEEIP